MLEEKASGALDSTRGLAQGSCLESEICLPLKCRLLKSPTPTEVKMRQSFGIHIRPQRQR